MNVASRATNSLLQVRRRMRALPFSDFGGEYLQALHVLAYSLNFVHSLSSVFDTVLYYRFRVASMRTVTKVRARHVIYILLSAAPSQLHVHR